MLAQRCCGFHAAFQFHQEKRLTTHGQLYLYFEVKARLSPARIDLIRTSFFWRSAQVIVEADEPKFDVEIEDTVTADVIDEGAAAGMRFELRTDPGWGGLAGDVAFTNVFLWPAGPPLAAQSPFNEPHNCRLQCLARSQHPPPRCRAVLHRAHLRT